MVVAQLVERSLPIPEVRGSNPVIGKKFILNNCIEETKIKKKRPGRAQLKKINMTSDFALAIDGTGSRFDSGLMEPVLK